MAVNGKKITIFQCDDSDNSPKIITIGASAINVCYAPRVRVKEILNDPILAKPGVYILKMEPSDKSSYNDRVYIGEGDPVNNRMTQHLSDDKQDFIECVILTSSNGELDKAHIKNMEYQLYIMANSCKQSELENATIPTKAALDDANQVLVDTYLDQFRTILPLCGFYCLTPSVVLPAQQVAKAISTSNGKTYHYVGKTYSATMIVNQSGYIVQKGSTASKTGKGLNLCYQGKRDAKIQNGSLVEKDGHYVFANDVIFPTASQAASVISGNMTNGRVAWVDANGKTLKDSQP